MERKVLNNKVTFYAGGKEVMVKLSNRELHDLRCHTNYAKGVDRDTLTMGDMYNFALYAFLDYDLKKSPSKAGRVKAQFPYHSIDRIHWNLETN